MFDKVTFANELKESLVGGVIPFWKGLRDDEFGGYYSYLTMDLKLDKKAVKGCILNSRILWFFSNAYLEGYGDEMLTYANHAYDFFKEYLIDQENGGAFWSVNYDGKPSDTTKHTYNQSLCIYALSSYYDATKKQEVLDIIYEIYDLIESKCRDDVGYLEAFTAQWETADNDKLSENGVSAEKTMNTHLHMYEAYTEFYRVTKDEKIGDSLRFLMELITENIYNPMLHRQEVFFDKEFNSLIDLHSYGHDIEACWLIDRGTRVLEDEVCRKSMDNITKDMAEEVFKVAYNGNCLNAENDRAKLNTMHVWWVQCEAMIGFYNEYQKSGREEFAEASYEIWRYIKDKIVDKRPGSEWYAEVNDKGEPSNGKPIVENWKCPYHNGRMFFEMIRRLTSLQ